MDILYYSESRVTLLGLGIYGKYLKTAVDHVEWPEGDEDWC